METPNVDPAKLEPRFKEIRHLCESEETFNDVVLKVTLLEVIVAQVNEIFIGSLYNPTASVLLESANNAVTALQESIVDTYISKSTELGELRPIPEIEEVTYWVQEIHIDILSQLHSEGFIQSVITPALDTITGSIVEFSKEEQGNEPDVYDTKDV